MAESNENRLELIDQKEKFYDEIEKYIGALSKRFQGKCVVKRNAYDDTLKSLLSPKGKPGAQSPKFIHWAKKRFILDKIGGSDVVCCIKSKKPLCVYES